MSTGSTALIARKSIRARWGRTLAIGLAITAGVSFVVGSFVLADSLDGTMARLSGRSSDWGAFLDSTLDRIADAAIFAGLAMWFVSQQDTVGVALSLAALVLGQVVSYARARAEGLGAQAAVGVAERTERLVVVLLATGLVGFGLPAQVLVVAMGLLAAASAVTVVQRMVVVRHQLVSSSPSRERT